MTRIGFTELSRTGRRSASWTVLLLAVGAGLAPSAAGQSSPVLDSVERSADLGEAGEARRLLADWFA
ncbi:MAG: hypothetical protein WBN79_02595, partial [Gemmatimonadota bacterium]